MLALLADAINVFQQGAISRATRKRLLYIDAERWIMMAAQPGPHAFSFETVCEALGINAGGAAPSPHSCGSTMSAATSKPSATPHLRLKITPRARHLSQRRGHQRSGRAAPDWSSE